MKAFALVAALAATISSSAFAASVVHIPEGNCLAKISAKVEALGMSENPAENKIDFENVLSVRGQNWVIEYYRNAGDPHSLDVIGRAAVRLDITRAHRDGRYVMVSDCRVYGARILSETRD